MMIFPCFQIGVTIRVRLCPVLLLQSLIHVRHAADGRVLWLHHTDVLRFLLIPRHRRLLLRAQIRTLHIRQRQNGLSHLVSILY